MVTSRATTISDAGRLSLSSTRVYEHDSQRASPLRVCTCTSPGRAMPSVAQCSMSTSRSFSSRGRRFVTCVVPSSSDAFHPVMTSNAGFQVVTVPSACEGEDAVRRVADDLGELLALVEHLLHEAALLQGRHHVVGQGAQHGQLTLLEPFEAGAVVRAQDAHNVVTLDDGRRQAVAPALGVEQRGHWPGRRALP